MPIPIRPLPIPRPTHRTALLLGAAAAVLAIAVLAVLVVRRGHDASMATATLVGAEQCVACHQEQAAQMRTAHHRTSRPATAASILGSFQEGENVLRTSNPYVHFRMEARPDGFYQTAVVGDPSSVQTYTEHFDLVVGSGRKGQTYLSWHPDGRLTQLPVSYWTELGTWANSPGYRDGAVNFGRPVTARCLECHSTWFASRPDSAGLDRFDRSEPPVLGISCERCHGPGSEHVARQSSPVRRLLGSGIVNPADLSRERQVEVCGLCHAGDAPLRAPAFTWQPGEPLEEYLAPSPTSVDQAVDVHGNQVALLASSPCFQGSDMTCSTCHDVHQPERNPEQLSGRCLSCHQPQSCGLFPEHGAELVGQCVDCHMPELPSNTIVSSHERGAVRARVRTHWIRVYPETAGR